uniref:Uncharacterized protein n=1 Tax=viral metagenome TaxID=1070528 RepID=A0A6C0ELY6_9ZZZZ
MDEAGDFDRIADLLDALVDATKESEDAARAAFQDLKEELDLKGITVDEFAKSDDGHWTMKGPNGDIDVEDYQDDKLNGRLEDAYKPIFGDALDTDAGKELLDKSQQAFDDSPRGKFRAAVDDWGKFGKDSGFDGCCDNYDDFMNKARANGWDIDGAEKQFMDAKSRLVDEVNEGAGPEPDPDAPKAEKEAWSDKVSQVMRDAMGWLEEKCKWLADMIKDNWLKLVVLFLIVLAAKDLYDFVKGVESAMSGCFSTTSDGKKCKVRALTCNDNDLQPQESIISSAAECDTCTDVLCQDFIDASNSAGYWLPLKLSDACACNPNATDATCEKDPQNCYPGSYDVDATSLYNDCGGKNPGACPVQPNSYQCKQNGQVITSGVPACKNASGCVPRCVGCANSQGDDCSEWCSGKIMKTAKGQSLGCNKCNFGCAVGATFGHFFSLPSGLWNDIKKVLVWIIIGLLVLIIGGWIIKKLLGWGEKEVEGGSESHTGERHVDIDVNVRHK